MYDRGKSDSPIVPAKPSNNAARAVAEAVEGWGLAKGSTASKTRPGHRAGQDASSALDRVRRLAVQDKEARFTALLHHVSVARLRAAYLACRPQAAAGVDCQKSPWRRTRGLRSRRGHAALIALRIASSLREPPAGSGPASPTVMRPSCRAGTPGPVAKRRVGGCAPASLRAGARH